MSKLHFARVLGFAAWLGSAAVPAQCDPAWLPGDPAARVSGAVTGTATWDPDGSGPLPARLVLAGALSGGPVIHGALVAWDGTQWHGVGSPPGTYATAVGVHSGRLVAAFRSASFTSQTIASFDGTAWQNLTSVGGVTGGEVRAFASFQGELVAGGTFTAIGGQALGRVARWNGSSWAGLGTGLASPTGGSVNALAGFGSRLYAGGLFATAGGVAATNLAAWNGSSWAAAGDPNGEVRAFAIRSTSSPGTTYLFAAGGFTTIGGVPARHVARLDAQSLAWTALGAGLPGNGGLSLRVANVGLSSFELTAAERGPGSGPNADVPVVRRWTGSTWLQVGTILDAWTPGDAVLTAYGGQTLVGLALGEAALRRFDGASWPPVEGPGMTGQVHCVLDTGADLVIGGAFRTLSGTAVNGIARGGPGAWQPLGAGFDGAVRALARAPNGDVVAAGEFSASGAQILNHVARWNGSSWLPLGGGTDGTVLALAFLANGELVAGGQFQLAGGQPASNIARWNGSGWSPLASGLAGSVSALLPDAAGGIYAGGLWSSGSSGWSSIARYGPGGWSPLGSGVNGQVASLAFAADGALLVGGWFSTAGGLPTGGIARWHGGSWSVVDPSRAVQSAAAMAVLPDGDLVVGGSINLGTVSNTNFVRLARFDGGAWSDLRLRDGTLGAVDDLVWRPPGELAVGGFFAGGGEQVASHFAQLTTPCPASAVVAGAGCAGAGGLDTLAATAQPWLGGVFRARCTGLANPALGIVVYGFTPLAVPLASLLPQGLPGCSLLTSAESTMFAPAAAGAIDTALAIPVAPSLVGTVLRHQVLALEWNAAAQVTGVTASNALVLTIGSF